MTSKKKIDQNELRRLMELAKKKTVAKKIESPLAKYDASGQLTCVVCNTIVKSDSVWAVHINSKSHRENITKRTKRKEQVFDTAVPHKKPNLNPVVTPTPKQPLKSILKNSHEVKKPVGIPADFFQSASGQSAQMGSTEVDSKASTNLMEVDEEAEENDEVEENGTEIPEGFFDDPKLDAKIRNVQFKDPIEEEWEQFQKEIKQETSKAQTIISEDQEEATAERQIDEIDEQLRHWTRVLNLEKKKETAVSTVVAVKTEPEDDASGDEDFDEFVDWRAKKSFL